MKRSPTLQRSLGSVLLLTAGLTTACEGIDDVDAEFTPMVEDGDAEASLPESFDAERGHVCGINTGPSLIELELDAGATSSGVLPVSAWVEDPASDSELEVVATVSLEGRTVSLREGAVPTELGAIQDRIRQTRAREERSWNVPLHIDAQTLGLGDYGETRGFVTLVARLWNADGTVDLAEQPIRVYYHREGGEWAFYGQEEFEGAQAPHWGLDEKMFAIAANAAQATTVKARDGLEDPELATRPSPDQWAPQTANATTYDVKICIDVNVSYTDAGLAGEDYWTAAGGYNRPFLGGWFTVEGYGNVVHVAPTYLGDGIGSGDPGSGCWSTIQLPHGYSFIKIKPGAKVNGIQTIFATNHDWYQIPIYVNHDGTYDVVGYSDDIAFDILRSMTRAQWLHNGGVTPATVWVRENASDSFFDSSTGEVNIETGDEHKKFLINHEYGHWLSDAGGENFWSDCRYDSGGSWCTTSSSHSMTSKEYSACAASEGWAHFVSADSFNEDNQTDCGFRYWSNSGAFGGTQNIDCESSTSTHPNRWMENYCTGSDDGYGAEVDWMKEFWDVHTNGSGVSMATMLDWLDNAGWVSRKKAYDDLNQSANEMGGTLNSNWDSTKGPNGVDH